MLISGKPDQSCGVGRCKPWLTLLKVRHARPCTGPWLTTDPDDHAVKRVRPTARVRITFGELTFPVLSDEVSYIHLVTVINR